IVHCESRNLSSRCGQSKSAVAIGHPHVASAKIFKFRLSHRETRGAGVPGGCDQLLITIFGDCIRKEQTAQRKRGSTCRSGLKFAKPAEIGAGPADVTSEAGELDVKIVKGQKFSYGGSVRFVI